MANLFQEYCKDLVEKKGRDTILSVVALVLSLIFVFAGISSTPLVNLILILNPVLIGWVLQAGWIAQKKGEKPKLLMVGGITLLLSILATWQLSIGIAQFAQLQEGLEDFRNIFQY